MSRSVVGGGKAGGSSYDPQIGASSAQAAATAAKAENFSEKYYNDVITPLLKQQNQASMESQGKLNNLYDLNAQQTKLAMDRYSANGIPAEDRYYRMASAYSEPAEVERQAAAAKGDFETAQAGQQANMLRRFAGMGIDPTSPAAQSAMADMAVQGTAIQAGAMNRARNAARTLGMQLTSDAANFGRGGTSQALAFGNSASGNATGAATFSSILSPATPAGASIKASAGRLIGWQLQNSSTGVRSVKFFNATAVTMGTTGAAFEVDIPAGGRSEVNLPGGIAFGTGIMWAVTAAKGLTDNTATGLAANDVSGAAFFA